MIKENAEIIFFDTVQLDIDTTPSKMPTRIGALHVLAEGADLAVRCSNNEQRYEFFGYPESLNSHIGINYW
jgi:hypothetical protein